MLRTAVAIPILFGIAIFTAFAAMVVALGGLLRHFVGPTAAAATVWVAVVIAGLLTLYTAVGGAIGWGAVVRPTKLRELRSEARRTVVAPIYAKDGRFLGIVPSVFAHRAGGQPPFVTVPLALDAIPTPFWRCAVALEDHRINSPLTFDDVDPIALARAYVAFWLPSASRQGASTLSEMVARELRGANPRPNAPLYSEFGRKWQSWQEAPAIAALFPDAKLAGAVAEFLPFVAGAPGSHFGPEVHGLALAAQTLFGKSPAQLDAGEAILLAAAIRKPVLVASADDERGVNIANARMAALKRRGGLCLSRASLPPGFDRERARKQLAAIHTPIMPGDGAENEDHRPLGPARRAVQAVGSGLPGMLDELKETAGEDWPSKVRAVHTSIVPKASLRDDFVAATRAVQREHASRLQIPLWDGNGHASITGVITDGNGAIMSEVSNAGGLSRFGPQPIGSIGKIVAAVLRARYDTAQTRYACPPGPDCPDGGSFSAREAFGWSKSWTVLRRLASNTEGEAQQAFAAFGLPAPPAGSARYNAAFGALSVKPSRVLRAGELLTTVISGRAKPVQLPHVVARITLNDGRTIRGGSGELEPTALERRLASARARRFVASVLRAPIMMGTLKDLRPIIERTHPDHFWGKTGTAEGAHHHVRVLWNEVGVDYRGRLFTILVVVAGSNEHPVGSGVEASAIAPMTSVLLHYASALAKGEAT